jgi:hypothetical protein
MMNPGDIAVLEMGEDEGGAGDVADLAGAGGDVAEGAPPAGEQGEPAFAEAAQGPLDGVAGAGADIELPPSRRLSGRDADADARALVTGAGGPVRQCQGLCFQPGQAALGTAGVKALRPLRGGLPASLDTSRRPAPD